MASGTVVHLNGHIQPFFFGLSLMIWGKSEAVKYLHLLFVGDATSQNFHCTLSRRRKCIAIQSWQLATFFQPKKILIHTNFLFMLTVDRLYSIITKKGSTENNNCIKFGSRD